MAPTQPTGLFITFEGSEGTGKTTQIERLRQRLEGLGRSVLTTREPGGPALCEDIRHLLKHADSGANMCPEAELLLFAASRAQHVREWIRPALTEGKVVLCDRFLDSTTVYQGVARAIEKNSVSSINAFAVGGTLPDITVIVDLDPEEGFRRVAGRKQDQPDRMEEEPLEFYRAVRQGYLDVAKTDPKRFLVVDGGQDPQSVEQAIWNGIKDRIG